MKKLVIDTNALISYVTDGLGTGIKYITKTTHPRIYEVNYIFMPVPIFSRKNGT